MIFTPTVLAAIRLSSAAAFPRAGGYVQAGFVLSGPGGADYQLGAQIIVPATGQVLATFTTAVGGGSSTATGSLPAQGQQVVVMYASSLPQAASVPGYDPSQGLEIQVAVNGADWTTAGAVFLPGTTGAQALRIVSVADVWGPVGGDGTPMQATVVVTNPSANEGQADLYGQVLVNGVRRESFGYTVVTVAPGGSVTKPVQTLGAVTNELAGDLAIPAFQLLVPGTATTIGGSVSGQGLAIPSASQYPGPVLLGYLAKARR